MKKEKKKKQMTYGGSWLVTQGKALTQDALQD